MDVLNRPVLVLNKSWVACGTVTVRRAINLLFKENAAIVNTNSDFYQPLMWDEWKELPASDDDVVIHTSTSKILVPEIIVLYEYNKIPNQRINYSKRAMFKRDNNCCQYCGKNMKNDELTADHVVPKSQGGKTSWANCVTCCKRCNAHKANRTPEQAKMKFFKDEYKPTKPKFDLLRIDVRIDSWANFLR